MTEPSEEQMPLAMVEPGRKVRVVSVDAGRRFRARLSAMGLLPGVELRVITNVAKGPFIVALRGTRVMIGRGMLEKIMVS